MAYTDSSPVPATLVLEGVWLHDPADPAGTAVNLLYGGASRSGDLAVEGELTQYQGRTYPVADYGPTEIEHVSVRADVPFGPQWAATLDGLRRLVRSRRPLMFRDNRGRAFLAAILAVQDTDAPAGTQVALTAHRVEV